MIILGHTTSLHILRHFGAEAVATLPKCPLALIGESCDDPTRSIERYLSFSKDVGATPVALHLLVPRGKHVEGHEFLRLHTVSPGSSNNLLRLGDGVYCAAPELVARQLAPWGRIEDLIYLLHELCGVYTYTGLPSLDLAERKPFATKESFEKFLSQQGRFPSSKLMAEALGQVRERSASPMETACAMFLGLPYRLGGLGFPDFEMNREIVVPEKLRRQLGRTRMYGDLCWDERRVVLEYDSSQWHGAAEQIARDSSRRSALMKLGYQVVTLTGGQATDRAELMRTADTLAEVLGHRVRPRVRDFEKRQHVLEWIIFRDKASVFSPLPNRRSAEYHPKLLVS